MAELTVVISELETTLAGPKAITPGDLADVLKNQAVALDRLFHELGHLALSTSKQTPQLDLLKVALRAQAQCAMTVKALSAPRSTEAISAPDVAALSDQELADIVAGGDRGYYEQLD